MFVCKGLHAEGIKRAPSARQGRKVRIDHFRGTTLFHRYLATTALWVPTHPNPVTGVPGASYFRSHQRFTSAAREGASERPDTGLHQPPALCNHDAPTVLAHRLYRYLTHKSTCFFAICQVFFSGFSNREDTQL